MQWTGSRRDPLFQLASVAHRCAECVIRGRNFLLPSLRPVFSKGGVQGDSWDTNSFKTTSLDRQFLRRSIAGAGSDRSSFEANRGLTYQEAASSIKYQRRDSRGSLKRKRGLDTRRPHRSYRRSVPSLDYAPSPDLELSGAAFSRPLKRQVSPALLFVTVVPFPEVLRVYLD